jgi:hypothetical protein
MDRFRKRDIERALERQLSDARETWRIAARCYRDLIPEIASLPTSDGQLQVRQLYAEQVRTQSAYRLALDRWTSFVRNGAVPDDLA